MISLAREAGFRLSIVYLFLDSPDMCVERVQERVRKGGHAVPEDDVRRRFFRSVLNFWQLYRPLADHWVLVYNSGHAPLDVAVGTRDSFTLRDRHYFSIYAQWLGGLIDG